MDLDLIVTWDVDLSLERAGMVQLHARIVNPVEGLKESYKGSLRSGPDAKKFLETLIPCTGLNNMRTRMVDVIQGGISTYVIGIPDEESPGKAVFKLHFPEESDQLTRADYLKIYLDKLESAREKKFFIASRNEYVDEPDWCAFQGRASLFASSDYPKGDVCERLSQFDYELDLVKGNTIHHRINVYLLPTYWGSHISMDAPTRVIDEFKILIREQLVPMIDAYKEWEHGSDRSQSKSKIREIAAIISEFKIKHGITVIFV